MGKKKRDEPILELKDYKVVGEEERQPVVKSWIGLIAFVAFFALAVFIRYLQIVS